MDVKNRLASIRVTVDHQPVPGCRNTGLPGNLVAHQQPFPHKRCILFLQIRQTGNMPFGNHQSVGRGPAR